MPAENGSGVVGVLFQSCVSLVEWVSALDHPASCWSRSSSQPARGHLKFHLANLMFEGRVSEKC